MVSVVFTAGDMGVVLTTIRVAKNACVEMVVLLSANIMSSIMRVSCFEERKTVEMSLSMSMVECMSLSMGVTVLVSVLEMTLSVDLTM